MRSLKPKIDESVLIHNPFSTSLVVRARTFETKSDYLTLKEKQEGTFTKIHKLNEELTLEYDSSVKLYTRSAFRLDIFSRTEKARSLFLWIAYEIEPGCDYLWVNKSRYMQEASVSLNTFKAALEELCLNKVLTPTIYPEYYWINPAYFFNGNRLKKYPSKVVTV